MSDSTKPEDKREKVYVGTGFHWGLAAVLLLIVLVAVVAAQNTDKVRFEFLWADWTVPLFVVILVVVVGAVVLVEVAGWLWRRRRRRLLTERDELKRLRVGATEPKVPITMPEPEVPLAPEESAVVEPAWPETGEAVEEEEG